MSNEGKKRIVIAGGSGFIGTKLTEALVKRGYRVTVVDLSPPSTEKLSEVDFISKDLVKDGLESSLVDGALAVINLAGASIGKRWSSEYKKLIYDSRVKSTKSIVEAVHSSKERPKILINASASGYYGDRGEELLSEDSGPGNDFLARLCLDWEEEAREVEKAGVRVVTVRTANVLGPGGLLSTLEPVFKWGLGGYFGSGKQFMPWVHWKDIVGIYIFALESEIKGAVNTGAGVPVTQKDLFKTFGKIIGSPIVWRIPFVFARVALGEFARALVASQRVDLSKIKGAGYSFRFENLEEALIDIYDKQNS